MDASEIRLRLSQTREALSLFAERETSAVLEFADRIVKTYRQGGKVLLFGNGGSAADAQHVAAELVNRMLIDRAPLPAVALTTDSSVLTSVANDYEYNRVFVTQVRALARPGDFVWAFSTSGRSENVNLALAVAREAGAVTGGMTGRPGSKMDALCDVTIHVDSNSTPVIQEVHIAASHIVCQIVEAELFAENKS